MMITLEREMTQLWFCYLREERPLASDHSPKVKSDFRLCVENSDREKKVIRAIDGPKAK